MNDNISCPVDFVLINENRARLTAFFVLLLAGVYLLTGAWLILLLLTFDFFLRTSNLGKLSLLGLASEGLIRQFKIANKPVDRGPKRFAAGMGLFFTALILVLLPFGLTLLVQVLTVALMFFAFLESAISFCVGCYVYAFGRKLLGR